MSWSTAQLSTQWFVFLPFWFALPSIILSTRGDCATCQVTLAGRYTKPCVAKVPAEPKLKSLQEKGLEIRV